MELNSTHLSKQVTSFNLEIGCGHGHWLTSFAQERTDLTFVGIDLITKRIDKANIKKNKRDLTNLHFIKADAIEFISCIPTDLKILNCYVMYPDPWPKARHHKRRLINQSFWNYLKQNVRMHLQSFSLKQTTLIIINGHLMKSKILHFGN